MSHVFSFFLHIFFASLIFVILCVYARPPLEILIRAFFYNLQMYLRFYFIPVTPLLPLFKPATSLATVVTLLLVFSHWASLVSSFWLLCCSLLSIIPALSLLYIYIYVYIYIRVFIYIISVSFDCLSPYFLVLHLV
jgi:hypothetical protein